MKQFTTQAHIHSLNGALDEVTIIEKSNMGNSYIADYKGTKCTAIFNCFAGAYYVDDVYGVLDTNRVDA